MILEQSCFNYHNKNLLPAKKMISKDQTVIILIWKFVLFLFKGLKKKQERWNKEMFTWLLISEFFVKYQNVFK